MLNKFQMTSFNHWKGLTKNNHLQAIYRQSPQKASDVMVQLLALHRGKNLESYLAQFPTKYFDTDDDFYWDAVGSSRRNIPIVEARDENGAVVTSASGNVGVGKKPFTIVFAEDWFAIGNVIVGHKNELYPLRILRDGVPEGSNMSYTVELMGTNMTGMPAEELLLGKRFSVEYSPVEQEMSREVGDIRFTSPISMRNEFSRVRIKHKVPGSMLGKKLAVGLPFLDKSGKKVVHDMWMHHVDYKLEETFSDEKATAIMFGTSNRLQNGEYKNFGLSGNILKTGSGIREQMEVANTMYYNVFSIKLIETMLYDLSTSKLGMGERRFVLRTGERGAALFHKAVMQEVNGWMRMGAYMGDNNPAVIKKVGSPLHDNALSVGFQFTEWRAPNGVIVSVEVDPFYDDEVRNKVLHPDGGVAESYRFDLMSIGTMDQPNIQIAKVKGLEEYRGYQYGFRNPFTGAVNNENMSFDEDACVVHKMATLGAIVLDPTRTASLIPSILA